LYSDRNSILLKYLRLLLLPLGWCYGLIVEGIKWSYRMGLKKAQRFSIPTIVVGNLSTGGTGKTPHVEYLLEVLSSHYQLAVLSRGYGRKTKGFKWVQTDDLAIDVGDEPLQIRQKFPAIPVVVAEKRARAIPKIIKELSQTELLLLDDAMQHWPVLADTYILLTAYQDPFYKDYILPAGNLREFRHNYKRAEIIIVTKCPKSLSIQERQQFINKLQPRKGQAVFFSSIRYQTPYALRNQQHILPWELLNDYQILLITGIAKPNSLVTEVQSYAKHIELLRFPDHHTYTPSNWKQIEQQLEKMQQKGKVLIFTTEKDAERLRVVATVTAPIFIVPISIEIAFQQADKLQQLLTLMIKHKKVISSST